MKTKLKKIIEYAVKNGLDSRWGKDLIAELYVERTYKINRLSSLLFSHDFAKAVFGEDRKDFGKITEGTLKGEIATLIGKNDWSIHLQQLVLLETDKERINYIYKYIYGL